LVKPGDVICGDDGVVVVPQPLVNAVIQEAAEDEALETWIKQELETKDVSPGRYYPVTEATKQAFAQAQRKRRGKAR
jgi:regulator of RNase E activity RraA